MESVRIANISWTWFLWWSSRQKMVARKYGRKYDKYEIGRAKLKPLNHEKHIQKVAGQRQLTCELHSSVGAQIIW